MSIYPHGDKLFFEVFFAQAERLKEKTAVHYCDSSSKSWHSFTWTEYGRRVRSLAGWLQRQNVQPGDRIAVLSSNRPEWVISDLAIMAVGAVSVPIYATTAPKDLKYIIEHSQAKIVFVDHAKRAKGLDLAGQNPSVVLMDMPSTEEKDRLSLTTIFYFHNIVHENSTFKQSKVSPNDLATIVYTSGTTGTPKGVVHTHSNIREVMKSVWHVLKPVNGKDDRYFSFLPLSHVAERVLVEIGSIMTGSEVAFARGIDTLMDDMQVWRPTILLCVPRLWEKIFEKTHTTLRAASPLKRAIFKFAQKLGSVRIKDRRAYRHLGNTISGRISDLLVGKALRKKLGMDRVRLAATGSAPTRPEIMAFFASFGILIREVYGLTENLCLGVLNDNDEIVFGSCGQLFIGGEIKIAQDGEICFKAPWNFRGYYLNDEATRETIKDGWLLTGDLGRLDQEGRLWIEGRKKELLKTSGGKYVAPIPIEDRLKESPIITEAMLVGDEMKFCIALVALNPEINMDKEAQLEELRKHLDAVNKNLASYESIKRLGILREGFSVESGTLTPTMKIKRKEVVKQFANFIDKVYHATETIVPE